MGVEDWIPTYHPSGAEKVKAEDIPTSNPQGSTTNTSSSNSSFCDKHGFLPTSDGGSSGVGLGGGKAKDVSTVTVGHTTSAELELEKGEEDKGKAKGEGK